MSTERTFREIGVDVRIFDPVAIIRPDRITLKSHIIVSEFAYIAGGLGTYIGNYIHLAAHTAISGGGYCVLGDFVGVAAGSRLITGTESLAGDGLPSPTVPEEFRSVIRSYVHVERHAFLGTGVIVQPGVTIGEGAVVASGGVVTRSLDPWGVYMGAPARRTRDRPKGRVLELAERLYEKQRVAPADFSEILKTVKQPR